MTNQIQNPKTKSFNLEERTARFGQDFIEFAKKIPENTINRPLISQGVRSSTSIGANYMEADAAESKQDFNHKISISKKEAKETMHWARMIAVANPELANECRKLWQEAHELCLIFSAILKKKKTK